MPPIKIIRQSEQASLLSNGQVQKFIRVDFQVGDDGPFSISVKTEDYSADLVHQKILEIANQTIALRGKLAGS